MIQTDRERNDPAAGVVGSFEKSLSGFHDPPCGYRRPDSDSTRIGEMDASEKGHPSIWFQAARFFVTVGVLYLLSIGPAMFLVRRDKMDSRLWETIWGPMFTANGRYAPAPVQRVFGWYIDPWRLEEPGATVAPAQVQ